MSDRRDWIRVCNNQGVSLEDFKAQFCDRCFQGECTRSQAGSSLFEARVSSWQERLFTAVPRMDINDPRYSTIRARKFLDIDQTPTPEIRSAWIDPRDLDETPKSPQAQRATPQALEEPPPAKTLDPEPSPAEPPAKTLDEEPPPAPEPLPTLMNTPFQQGQMLGNRQQPAKAPVKDPWAAPTKKVAETDDTKVVQPGARIKLGG